MKHAHAWNCYSFTNVKIEIKNTCFQIGEVRNKEEKVIEMNRCYLKKKIGNDKKILS